MSSYAGGGSGGSPDHVETRVEGSPGELRAQARWLRTSLAGDLDEAGERQAEARRAASSGWEGDAGAAYGEVGRLALQVTDDHADRTRRAAEVVDDVADRIAALRETMAGLRDEARAGGLIVVGTTVSMPLTPAPGPDVLLDLVPGVPAQRRALLRRIAGDVARARSDHAAWLDRRLDRARADAAERGDLDGALSRMAGGVAGASPGAGPDSAGGASSSGTALAGGGAGEAPVAGAPGGTHPAPGPGGGALVGSPSPFPPGRDGTGRAAGGSATAPWAPRGDAQRAPWAPRGDVQPAPWAPVGELEPAPWAPVGEHERAPWLLGAEHDEAPWRERAPAC